MPYNTLACRLSLCDSFCCGYNFCCCYCCCFETYVRGRFNGLIARFCECFCSVSIYLFVFWNGFAWFSFVLLFCTILTCWLDICFVDFKISLIPVFVSLYLRCFMSVRLWIRSFVLHSSLRLYELWTHLFCERFHWFFVSLVVLLFTIFHASSSCVIICWPCILHLPIPFFAARFLPLTPSHALFLPPVFCH